MISRYSTETWGPSTFISNHSQMNRSFHFFFLGGGGPSVFVRSVENADEGPGTQQFFVGLTRLGFPNFQDNVKGNGEYTTSNAMGSTQRRCLRWRRCVCIFFFCVSFHLMTSMTVHWLIFREKRSMSNRSHRKESRSWQKILSLPWKLSTLLSRISLLLAVNHWNGLLNINLRCLWDIFVDCPFTIGPQFEDIFLNFIGPFHGKLNNSSFTDECWVKALTTTWTKRTRRTCSLIVSGSRSLCCVL